jgi:hypothetical protein
VRSSLDDLIALDTLVRQCDAVFCLLGARPPHRDVFCATATGAIIESMRREHVDRLLCLTGAMVSPEASHLSLPMRTMAALFRRSRPDVAADRASQEMLVRESRLRWTIFKPPRLTSERPTGPVRVNTDLRVNLRSFVPRQALAACLLAAAEQDLFIGESVYLSAA